MTSGALQLISSLGFPSAADQLTLPADQISRLSAGQVISRLIGPGKAAGNDVAGGELG